MSTSFISEHSAEYVLVARLDRILTQHFGKVVPMYFWATREGSAVSRECNPSQMVKVVSVFARRPKVSVPSQPFVRMRINQSILQTATLSASLDIPTFAGIPLVSSILDFGLDVDCAWFELRGDDADVVYEISCSGEVLSESSPLVRGPLTEDELARCIVEKTVAIRWTEAIERLRTIRRGSQSPLKYWPVFGGGYHPFTFLLMD